MQMISEMGRSFSINEYMKHWSIPRKDPLESVSKNSIIEDDDSLAANLTKSYYDAVTWLYELGWGKSLHFCRMYNSINFKQAIIFHELFLFSRLGIPETDEKWADLGCGIGGPMRNAVLFGNDKVTVYGINNNETQIRRCKQLNEANGLSDKAIVMNSTFSSLPLNDNSMDKVYAIEATCHASDLNIPYKEAFRVLKPGGLFACYEWVVTDKFQKNNEEMIKNLMLVQEGCSLVKLHTVQDCKDALNNSGFQILEMTDLALKSVNKTPREAPWYTSLTYDHGIPVLDQAMNISHALLGKIYIGTLNIFEKIGAVQAGSASALKILQKGGEGLVNSGRMGIYTPMLFLLARKPE